jgi:hypothetical protein
MNDLFLLQAHKLNLKLLLSKIFRAFYTVVFICVCICVIVNVSGWLNLQQTNAACVCTYVCVRCMYVCVCVCVYMSVFVRLLCRCTCVYMFVRVSALLYVYVIICYYMYVCMHLELLFDVCA